MKKIIVIVLSILFLSVNTVSSLDISKINNIEKNEREYIALVVTIVDYEYDVNDLNIPVDMMYSPLVSAKNWHEENILFVKNENATKENILKGLDWLADRVDENDIALFYFGGHGLRKDDEDGDESDGEDEAIATYERGGYILDDQLKLKFDNISAGGLFILIDCCHSGGVVDNDFVDEFEGTGRVVIASDFESAVCLEVKGLGTLLTLSLKRIISKSMGDINDDGIISAEETFSQLKKIFRRLNLIAITGIFAFVKSIQIIFGRDASRRLVLFGLTGAALWEMFCIVAFGSYMVPYYPIMTDNFEGELAFIEV